MGVELETLKQIDEKLNDIARHQADISELKSLLRPIADKLVSDMTAGTATTTTSGIINTLGASYGTSHGGLPVHAGFRCKKCGTTIGLLVGSDNCPTCGAPIN